MREQDRAVAAAKSRQLPVGPERRTGRRERRHSRREPHRAAGTEYELALLEDQPLVLEQEAKKRLEHGSAIVS